MSPTKRHSYIMANLRRTGYRERYATLGPLTEGELSKRAASLKTRIEWGRAADARVRDTQTRIHGGEYKGD